MAETANDAIDGLVHWDMLEDPSIIERCRQQLRTDGIMVLPNFATPDGLHLLLNEIKNAPYNEIHIRQHTPYQDQGDPSYPPDHPRNVKVTSSVAFVGRQTLETTPEKLGLSMYYHRNRILNFVSKVANTTLYRSQDDNGSCYSYRIHENHTPEWHYDEAPYTAIIYLQNDGAGGDLQLVPWSRGGGGRDATNKSAALSKDDPEGHETVRKILMEKDWSNVRSVPAEPGSLVFFSGSRSFHRAAPIQLVDENADDDEQAAVDNKKEMLRLGLVFTFGETDDFSNSSHVKDNNKWDPEDH